MVRTSITHPLRIDTLPLANGHLGITFCPGKKGDSVYGAPWDRDLGLDLDAIKDWGGDLVVSLIEDHEFDMLCVPDLAQAIRSRKIEWIHFPITDLGVPTNQAMRGWRSASARIHTVLERGGRVVIHCRGGLGRAGTIAALLLTERGSTATEAMERVRAVRPNAIETAEQENWLPRQSPYINRSQLQLFACLIGGAIGDSLGAEIEFLSLQTILSHFPYGISELPPHQELRGAITDDTQMTLFTAEGIIRAAQSGEISDTANVVRCVHQALQRWHVTQGGTSWLGMDLAGLITDRRLWASRAPGLTCLSALSSNPVWGDLAQNDSKGCGTIMRVAPVALMMPRELVRDIAIQTSALTHGHPTGQLAAAAWAEILADVSLGATLEEAARATAAAYASLENGQETEHAIKIALNAPRDGSPRTVETIGDGWTADEALSIALYSCLAGQSVDHALQIAVVHSGDSDSTGAIAGNMLGVMNTAGVLEHRWASQVECSDIISRLVGDYLSTQNEGR